MLVGLPERLILTIKCEHLHTDRGRIHHNVPSIMNRLRNLFSLVLKKFHILRTKWNISWMKICRKTCSCVRFDWKCDIKLKTILVIKGRWERAYINGQWRQVCIIAHKSLNQSVLKFVSQVPPPPTPRTLVILRRGNLPSFHVMWEQLWW